MGLASSRIGDAPRSGAVIEYRPVGRRGVLLTPAELREYEKASADCGRSLGRQIRAAVWAHRGDEAEALFLGKPLHVGGENSHGRSSLTLYPLNEFREWSG